MCFSNASPVLAPGATPQQRGARFSATVGTAFLASQGNVAAQQRMAVLRQQYEARRAAQATGGPTSVTGG